MCWVLLFSGKEDILLSLTCAMNQRGTKEREQTFWASFSNHFPQGSKLGSLAAGLEGDSLLMCRQDQEKLIARLQSLKAFMDARLAISKIERQ